jgi:hypothetical protein
MPVSFSWTVDVGASSSDENVISDGGPVAGELLPRDIKLDLATGRLDLSSGGLELTYGAHAVAQSILIRIRTFLGEWFADRSQGVDYFGRIFVKGPTPDVIRAELREEILDTEGVSSVPTMTLDLDEASRNLSVDTSAESDYGEITVALGIAAP